MAQQKRVVPAGIDIEADAVKTAKPEELAAIIALAKQMYKLQLQIEVDTIALNKKAVELNTLSMTTLPERMTSAGIQSFELNNGYVIEIKDFIRANIPTQTQIDECKDPMDKQVLAKRRKDGIAWLKKHDGEALLKNTIKATFGKGESAAAKKFAAQIGKAGYQVQRDESVNFQTLNAFIRERLEEGKDVPTDTFALFNGKKAEIKKKVQK
jgi:hypothetical protein